MASTTQDVKQLESIACQIRRWILTSTHRAGSGHPTSSLSAVELMTGLFFHGHFRFNVASPDDPNNDRLIFSKGHASPLLYALWAAAGAIREDQLEHYREFDSVLEGHPTSRFRYTEAATGSLGQGLSIGLGMAIAAKYLDDLPYRTFVLLGDSEMAEGSQWEAIQLADHYQLNNLIGILDVNRLGQRGPTMVGYDIETYSRRVEAFGWRAIEVEDGHDFDQIHAAYDEAFRTSDRPAMIIARTVKGKGVSSLEDQGGWHGKALDDDQVAQALEEIGESDFTGHASLEQPREKKLSRVKPQPAEPAKYSLGDEVATRDAYGNALVRLAHQFPQLVSLDGEVSNSTRAKKFADAVPDRFFEMYIAEQNMVGAATGLALRGWLPFVSTFAAFLTRAFDQIRMAAHSDANVKFVGSHAGVSIGQDGPSQMGLEDLAMFRTVPGCTVLYPCDAVATEKLVEALAASEGLGYLRTTRGKTPVIYGTDESFSIGGSKVVQKSDNDQVTVVAAGITLHQAIAAAERLRDRSIAVRIIDLYSIQPIDVATLREAAEQTGAIITVEDHYHAGGIGEAVRSALAHVSVRIESLAVSKKPRSGDADRLLANQGIDADAIIHAIDAVIAS